jgi:rhamnulokinase
VTTGASTCPAALLEGAAGARPWRAVVVRLVGSGAHNMLLYRLTADATRLPIVAGPAEVAALGNVLVQARAAGVVSGGLPE